MLKIRRATKIEILIFTEHTFQPSTTFLIFTPPYVVFWPKFNPTDIDMDARFLKEICDEKFVSRMFEPQDSVIRYKRKS